MVGPRYRVVVGVLVAMSWSLGYAMTPGLAYLVRSDRNLQLTSAALHILTISLFL